MRAFDPGDRVARLLCRAAPGVIRTLTRELPLSRAAAAESLAAAAGLGLAGLARHQRRRPGDSRAAVAVVKKFGRPMDLAAPELGIAAHLARPDLSPRLGGLLGDGGLRAAQWIARRSPGTSEEAAGRALAATTPLILGAMADAVEPHELTRWLVGVADHAAEDPEALLEPEGDPPYLFRRLRRCGEWWWVRALGIAG